MPAMRVLRKVSTREDGSRWLDLGANRYALKRSLDHLTPLITRVP